MFPEGAIGDNKISITGAGYVILIKAFEVHSSNYSTILQYLVANQGT
jgi:hypothetical protein